MLRMKGHRFPGRSWMVVVIGATLIAGHGFFLYYVSSHLVFSAVVLWATSVAIEPQYPAWKSDRS